MPKQKQDEKKMIDAIGLLDKMVALTFTRHSKMSSEEFLKELKVEGSDEDAIVRGCRMTLLQEISKEILRLNDKVELLNETIKLLSNKQEKEETK